MTVKITRDRAPALLKAMKALERQQVMVGVPGSKTERENDEPITNAALGYIHEFGSPAANIPARPFLIPGIKDAEGRIAAKLKAAGRAALDGDARKVDESLHAAGTAARNAAVERISEGVPPPLAPATIRARWNKIKGNRGKPVSEGFASEAKPLMDTGHLRAAIAYVLRLKRG